MGFLKRFFSIGSRRKKNKRILPDPVLGRIQEEEQEAAASRLLRSSSSRFTVVSEVDYSNLPPMRKFPYILRSAPHDVLKIHHSTSHRSYRAEPNRVNHHSF